MVINLTDSTAGFFNELNDTEKEYDVSFVGGLGDRFWKKELNALIILQIKLISDGGILR